MIALVKRGGYWYARGVFENVSVYKSLKTRDKDLAAAKVRAMENNILAGGMLRAIAWPEFLTEFTNWIRPHVKASSREKYEFVGERFGTFLRGAGLASLRGIGPSVISAYQQDRMQDEHPTRGIKVGPEGMKSDLRILRRIFSYAVQCGYLRENPVKVPRLNTTGGKTQPFTKEEIQKMMADRLVRLHPDLRAMVLTFLFTGLRISDVAGLRLDSIRWDENRLELVTKKRDKPLSLPLHPELAAALKVHVERLTPAQKASGLVFPTPSGKPNRSVDALMRRMWKRCGIVGGHCHRWRDTFAVALLAAGASLYDVSKLLAITMGVCERHYSPYVRELRERGRILVESARFPALQVGT